MRSLRQAQLAALAVVMASMQSPIAPAADPDDFTPLFNGKDLAGWVNVNCASGTFFVKSDEIITTGEPTGFLRTDKQYENFILEFEWMHVRKGMANSGLFVWGDPLPATGTPYTRGIEVQVLINYEADWATSHGDIFSIWGAKCTPDRPHPKGAERCLPSEKRVKGAGQWNHYKVIANDGVIKLHVNGKEVSGVSKCTPRKGYLALESEGAECHFRNIKIKELPSTNPKPAEVAKLAEGHTSLFTGIDLTGWKTENDSWKAAAGHLRAAGKANLETEKSYGQFELVFDCKMPAKSKAEWFVEFGTNHLHAIGNADVSDRGKWNRIVVTVGPDEISHTINGRQVAKATPGVGAGPIRFKPAEGLELMNLFIRELKGNK